MDAWADVEGAIQSALEQRKQNIERLTALSALTKLIGAVGWFGRQLVLQPKEKAVC